MEVIYNNVLYNTRTQNELEDILNANFINVSQEHFVQCVIWYQSFISGLVQILEYYKSAPAQLIHDSIMVHDSILANVDFMLYPKGDRLYAYIHDLSIISHPASFPLIAK